ncbi:hypothetical protein [Pseudonocardia sp. TRM90224]|uniref:hypothetical protein n=1 Tax=Pseudonocardia sp. TRM90224 TaxID=2812678 RepID=UPI001E2D3C00|nr:hypothetical protein [Pseudonocardia sp. TRM90224]
MDHRELRLGVAELCAPRFVPLPDRPVPDEVSVYECRSSGWGTVPATEAEAEEWQRAAEEYLDALSAALRELYLDHGGWPVYGHVDLRRRTWSHRHVPRPFPLPGRRRRLTRRSHTAQRAFLARFDEAEAAYRPVREEIERRLAEQRARFERQPKWTPERSDGSPHTTHRGTSHHSSHGVGGDSGSAASHGTSF